MISNNGADTASGVLYRGGDAFLATSDFGFGFTEVFGTNRNAVACSVNENNMPPAKIEEWIPFTGGNNYFQNDYDTVWGEIGSQVPFPDTCACTDFLDNGGGISWNFSIPAGGSATYSHVTLISSQGLEGLVTSKTADSSTSQAGTQNGYTITIQNPNASDVTVNSITDTLPAGFVYVPGSTTGVTTDDPTIVAQLLTWNGSFSVPARDSISLHFAVIVADTPGDHFNEAGGSAEDGYNVIPTGPTAQVTVTEGPTPTPTPTAGATSTPTATATPLLQLRRPQQLPLLQLLPPQPPLHRPQPRRRVQRLHRPLRQLQPLPTLQLLPPRPPSRRRQPQRRVQPLHRLQRRPQQPPLLQLLPPRPPSRRRQPRRRVQRPQRPLRRPQQLPLLQLLPPRPRSHRRQHYGNGDCNALHLLQLRPQQLPLPQPQRRQQQPQRQPSPRARKIRTRA